VNTIVSGSKVLRRFNINLKAFWAGLQALHAFEELVRRCFYVWPWFCVKQKLSSGKYLYVSVLIFYYDCVRYDPANTIPLD
jgi:hypothetical protein